MSKKKEAEQLRRGKILDLSIAMLDAEKAAMELKDSEDGGTCNFDTPMIKLDGWKASDIEEMNKAADHEFIQVDGKITSGMWKGYYRVGTSKHGQAACRTRMAEAAKKVLAAAGYDVAMYYQMD